MKKLTLSLFTLLLLNPLHVSANDRDNRDDNVPPIQLRNSYDCSDLQVENTVDWLKGYDQSNRLNERIGIPKNQGSVGWCFSYAARDLIHSQTDIEPELGIIAKDYYTGFVGSITGFLSSNEGGYTYNNLKRVRKNGICEKGFISSEATPENVEDISCTRKRVSIKKYGKPKKYTSTHKGRAHPLFKTLDNYLANNKMVGISYNANGLYKNEYRADNFFTKNSANHASSIVGRYFDNQEGVCRYVIRNSWGTHFNYALSGPQREGYHTITEKELSQSLSDLTVFE